MYLWISLFFNSDPGVREMIIWHLPTCGGKICIRFESTDEEEELAAGESLSLSDEEGNAIILPVAAPAKRKPCGRRSWCEIVFEWIHHRPSPSIGSPQLNNKYIICWKLFVDIIYRTAEGVCGLSSSLMLLRLISGSVSINRKIWSSNKKWK